MSRNAALLAGFRREGCLTSRAARTCVRALALAQKSASLLEQLLESGELKGGCCAEAALDLLEQTIGMLEPAEPEPGDALPERSLRLVVDNTRAAQP